MRVLILGATGMAGHLITLYFKERGYDTVAFATRKISYCECIVGDAFELDKLQNILIEGKYDVVINCIGLLNQTAEDNPDKAIFLNSYLPHILESWLKDKSTKLIHMSTDCVFAGNTGPYTEKSFPDGKTMYDRSKALGEINNNKDLTFRNSIIGPDMKCNGIGLFNWFMKQTSSIYGFTGAIWTGVTTLTLAKAIEKAIDENLTGIYNLVNNETISKYDLLNLFNCCCKKHPIEILKNNDFNLDKTLINTRKDFSFQVPSYKDMIVEMKDWIDEHSGCYPIYYYQ